MLGSKKNLAWYKRALFNAAMFACAWGIVELTACIYMTLNVGSLDNLSQRRFAAAKSDPKHPGGFQFSPPTKLHPYIGIVMDPLGDKGAGDFSTTDYGFADEGPPIHKRSPDRLIVAIVGGSVARQFSMNATDLLATELSTCPEFAGRKIQFVRLAGNGYKQPQQLMTITYMLSLGGEFDVLINIDGLNESALPKIDNIPFGVNCTYPRDWSKLVAMESRPEYLRIIGHVTFLRSQMQSYAKRAGSFPFIYSPISQLVWHALNEQLQRQLIKELERATVYSQSELKRMNTGPIEHFPTEHDADMRCIEVWQQCSILLDRICKANRIRYFHFLQPNQYVPNSKPIGPLEANGAVTIDHPVRTAVENCFPIMRTNSAKLLQEEGVAFCDLTQVFADHPEPIYIDTCCHVQMEGDLIMAKAIGARIRKFMER